MRRALLAWYDRESRSLPWRTHPSPYRTVVSEFMLQQTQVATVLPYFEKFIARFPNFAALARASEGEVLAHWSGLGYYRRARALRRTAERVMKEFAGSLPNSYDALRSLPGFGDYTAAAVGSIALSIPVAAVDGNVRRVVSRLFAIPAERESAEVPALALRLLDPDRPGDWNQAMMELGALVCSPREPRCLLCPIHADCAGRLAGEPEAFPKKKNLPATKRVDAVAVAAIRRGAVLVLQRGEGGRFAGMWELPMRDSRDAPAELLEPKAVLFDLTRLRSAKFDPAGESASTFTQHRITTKLFVASGAAGSVRRQIHIDSRWVKAAELADLAASKAQKRLFELLKHYLS